MADGPLSAAAGYKQYDDLLGQSIAANQARLSAAPTSPLSNVDPVMLSLAQGLLSPTKTGGFGESLGIAANAIQAPLSAMQKQKLDAQGKIDELQLARAKLAMEAPYYAARAEHYGNMGDGTGANSLSQQRLITEGLLKELGGDFDSEQDNPITGQPYADEAEYKTLKRQLRQKYFALGGFGGGGATPGSSKDTPKDDTVPPAEYPDAKRGTNPQTGKQGWYVVKDGQTFEVQ